MGSKPLPDPVLRGEVGDCLGCGYALAGLAAPGRCPECGRPFDAAAIILHGVPARGRSGSRGRSALIVALCVGTFVAFQATPFLIGSVGIGACSLPVVLGGGLLVLLLTGRKHEGTMRFVIGPAGIASMPLRPAADGQAASFFHFEPGDGVFIRRVSSVWKRIKIGRLPPTPHPTPTPGRDQRTVVMDFGVRCPDADAQPLADGIRAAIAASTSERPNASGPTALSANDQ